MRSHTTTPTIRFDSTPLGNGLFVGIAIEGADISDDARREAIVSALTWRIRHALDEAALDREEQRAAQDATRRLRLVAGGRVA